MTTEQFAEEIHAHVFGAPLQDEARGSFSARGRIVDAVRNIVGRLGDAISTETKQALLTAALQVYDLINLPTVPDVIETPVKQMLRPVIESMVRGLLGLAA